MRIKSILLFLLVFMLLNISAQDNKNNKLSSIYVGYYAPYGNQFGARVGVAYPFKKWNTETRIKELNITPKLGYFVKPDIQQNYILDVALEYKWYKPSRKMQPKLGFSLGYLLSRQNVDGTVNLANGNINFRKRTLNAFVPTINFGFERKNEKLLSYYYSVFYGRKFLGQEVNSDFVGLEIGLIFNLSKKGNE